jgi:hypothetical protein
VVEQHARVDSEGDHAPIFTTLKLKGRLEDFEDPCRSDTHDQGCTMSRAAIEPPQ